MNSLPLNMSDLCSTVVVLSLKVPNVGFRVDDLLLKVLDIRFAVDDFSLKAPDL